MDRWYWQNAVLGLGMAVFFVIVGIVVARRAPSFWYAELLFFAMAAVTAIAFVYPKPMTFSSLELDRDGFTVVRPGGMSERITWSDPKVGVVLTDGADAPDGSRDENGVAQMEVRRGGPGSISKGALDAIVHSARASKVPIWTRTERTAIVGPGIPMTFSDHDVYRIGALEYTPRWNAKEAAKQWNSDETRQAGYQ